MSVDNTVDPRRRFHSICIKLLNRILILVAVIAFIISTTGMSQAFEDDFSTDKEGWISSPPTAITRDSSENNVHWQVSRSSDQRMYREESMPNDFKMNIDAVIDDASNNCNIDIGLLNDINDFSKNNLFLRIGYYGGGTPYRHWYACILGKYNDGTAFTSLTGEVTPSHDTWGGYAPINRGQWYSYELEKTGSTWSLKVYDRNTPKNLIKELSGTFTGEFSPFDYIYFGNSDTGDWPSSNGRIDNILLSRSSSDCNGYFHEEFDSDSSLYFHDRTDRNIPIDNQVIFGINNQNLNVAKLVFPAGTSGEFKGPNAGAQISTFEDYAYGTYKAKLKTADCGSDEGVVNGFFTYCDEDTSEIDFEILGSCNQLIYMTIWQYYTDDNSFKKVTRVIDLSNGAIWETPSGKENTYELLPLDYCLPQIIEGFDASISYYEYGFTWDKNFIKFFIIDENNKEIELWRFDSKDRLNLPSKPAKLMFNVWHTQNWHCQTSGNNDNLNPPDNDAILLIDWAEYNPYYEYKTDFEEYTAGTTPPELYIYYNGKGNSYQMITTDAAKSGSKSFQVWGKPSWCSNVHYYFSKPNCGRIGYQVWVKANPREEGGVQFVNPEGATWSWGWGGVTFNQEGYITAPGGFKRLHELNRWYKVRAEMDVESGACWIWLDDELVTDGITPAEEGIANPDAYKGVRGVIFLDCSWYENPSTPTYFDDFRFYTVQQSVSVVAEANGPYLGVEGTPIIFDASGSYGSSRSSLSYRWDFNNDNNWDTNWSNEPTASFTYGDNFIGKVKLEVRDGTSIGSDTAAITIENINPIVKIDSIDPSSQYFIFPYDTLKFKASFSDPGWQDEHMSNWNFGDGSNYPGDLNEATKTLTSEHEYIAPGTYDVILTVNDDDNGIGTKKVTLTVVTNEEALNSINNYIQGLPNSAFNQPSNRKKAFSNKFAEIENHIANGNYLEAIAKLKNDIRSKADGAIGGNPNNDWIKDSIAQEEVCLKIDYLVTYLGKLQFRWCDQIWNVKSGNGGPGVTDDNPKGNYWSINNVWLDDEENLHLKISKNGNRWYCAEIWTNERLPFGKYQFWINSKITELDKNVVLGMFNYPAEPGFDGTNEIDIEIAKWGDDNNLNGNYAVYPGDVCDYNWNDTFSLSHLPIMNDYTTHRFDWSSTGVLFQSLQGHRNWGDFTGLIKSNRTPFEWAQHIPQQPLPVHINLWLFQSMEPQDPVEIVIEKFDGPSIAKSVNIRGDVPETNLNSVGSNSRIQSARESVELRIQRTKESANSIQRNLKNQFYIDIFK